MLEAEDPGGKVLGGSVLGWLRPDFDGFSTKTTIKCHKAAHRPGAEDELELAHSCQTDSDCDV